jgi:hypothetical protein
MADGLDFDLSELERLAGNIGRASGAVIAASRAVVAKGAVNIKNDTRKNISDDPSWRRIAQTVNYEQVGLSAEVGYDDVGQGELAGIYEFGSARRAPHPTLLPAAAREVPNFERALAEAAGRATEATL